MNRILIIRMLVVVVLAVIFWVATRNLKLVPGRGQVAFEFITGFVRNNIIVETLGEKDGRRFMPLLFTIFFLTLGLNITGTIPGLQIASTGLIGQALIMAVVAYFTFIYAGHPQARPQVLQERDRAAGRADLHRRRSSRSSSSCRPSSSGRSR